MSDYKIIVDDCSVALSKLKSNSIQSCITSPPYWGLRDYGTATWVGGDTNCTHRRESKKSKKTITGHKNFDQMHGVGDSIYKTECPKCGAIRKDDQLGLESSPDEYVANMVNVFRAVERVLKDDGTLWLNLGDTYCGTGHKGDHRDTKHKEGRNSQAKALNNKIEGLKQKDLIGIPWRVAFALQADGWYLRQDIIWHKPNPMPEPVKDRCTKSHEYIFLLSKSKNYYFNSDAIALNNEKGKSNKRDVWSVNTQAYKGAHFATFPKKLIEPCILAGSQKGDTILDPFAGSGTTGLVSLENHRKFTGIELNPEYKKIADQRISTAQPYLL